MDQNPKKHYRRLDRGGRDRAAWDQPAASTRMSVPAKRRSSIIGARRPTQASSQERGSEPSAEAQQQLFLLSQDFERRTTLYDVFVKNVLLVFVLLSVVSGFALGFLLRQNLAWSEADIALIRFPGDLFLRLLQCLSIPLAMTSVIGAVGSWKPSKMVRFGLRTLAYTLCTTLVAALTGLALVVTIRPGGRATRLPPNPLIDENISQKRRHMGLDNLFDIVRNLIPGNVIEAFIFMTQTTSNNTGTGHSRLTTVREQRVMSANVMGLVTFSTMLGFAIAYNDDGPQNSLLRFVLFLSNKFMAMADMVLWYSPVGICFLIAADVLMVQNIAIVVWHLGIYAFTVLLGLGVHAFLFLPAIYMIYVGRNAGHFFLNLLYPLSVAFGTSSSLASSPVTITTLETRIGLSPGIVRFVLPFGALFNRDGTALYEVVSVLYIAQLREIELRWGYGIIVSVAGSLLTFGICGLPPAYRGTTHMTFLLSLVGVEGDDVGFVVVTHWLLQRFCSAINLLSDCIAVAVIQKLQEQETIASIFQTDQQELHTARAPGTGTRKAL